MVVHGTGVSVVAGGGGGNKLATYLRVAGVFRTVVGVVAKKGYSGLATTQGALIVHRAHIPIVARVGIQLVGTTLQRVTRIVGARVVIVAILELIEDTPPALAVVAGRAGIRVVALVIVGHTHAANRRVARIIGARIQIVAVRRRAHQANAIHTFISHRACVAVRATGGDLQVDAAGGGFAEVVCALIAVVAIEGYATGALPVDALLARCARITIIAGRARSHRLGLALPGLRHAPVNVAVLVHAFRFVARSLAPGHLGTGERWRHGVTIPISETFVVLGYELTLLVGGALAVAGESHAIPGQAGVAERTGVGVVASKRVELVPTTKLHIAPLIGARVLVIAHHRTTDAHPGLAVVADGARVPVQALSAVQGHVAAPVAPKTLVVSAGISVITSHVVRLAVAIVVDAVANLFLRSLSITLTLTFRSARDRPGTHSELIGGAAGSGQRLLDCILGAITIIGLIHALCGQQPFHRGYLAALISCRALLVRGTGRRAEMARVAVTHTCDPEACNVLASTPAAAGKAKRGKQAGAYKHDVRFGHRQLRALETCRALLNAGLAAHLFPHVQHAVA